MTQLPKPTHVAEARAFLRQWLEELKDKDFLGDFVATRLPPTLHPDAGETFARRCFKLEAMKDTLGMWRVIDAARDGSDEAHMALSELVAEYKHHHQRLPLELDNYATEALFKRHRRRGRRKSRNVLQDMIFAVMMAEMVHKFGLHPTRKIETHRDSACDILAVAVREAKWLKRSFNYKAAERLWYQWGIVWAQDLARGDRKI